VIAQVGDTVYWMEEQKIMTGRVDREAINHPDEAIVHVSDGTVRVLNVFGLYVDFVEISNSYIYEAGKDIEKIERKIDGLKKERDLLCLKVSEIQNNRDAEILNKMKEHY
jgi:hypothetical protein